MKRRPCHAELASFLANLVVMDGELGKRSLPLLVWCRYRGHKHMPAYHYR